LFIIVLIIFASISGAVGVSYIVAGSFLFSFGWFLLLGLRFHLMQKIDRAVGTILLPLGTINWIYEIFYTRSLLVDGITFGNLLEEVVVVGNLAAASQVMPGVPIKLIHHHFQEVRQHELGMKGAEAQRENIQAARARLPSAFWERPDQKREEWEVPPSSLT